MQSNEKCEDQNLFGTAIAIATGVALGGGAILGGRSIAKGAAKKGAAKKAAKVAKKNAKSRAKGGTVGDVIHDGIGEVKKNIKKKNIKKTGEALKDTTNRAKDIVVEDLEWNGTKKNNMQYNDNGQVSMFNPNARNTSKTPQAEKVIDPVASTGPLDGQESLFDMMDNPPAPKQMDMFEGIENNVKDQYVGEGRPGQMDMFNAVDNPEIHIPQRGSNKIPTNQPKPRSQRSPQVVDLSGQNAEKIKNSRRNRHNSRKESIRNNMGAGI